MKRIAAYLRYYWRLTEGFHRTLVMRTLMGIVRVSLTLTVIWLSKTAIDCATGRVPAPAATIVKWFALMGAGMIAAAVVAQAVNYIVKRNTLRMENHISRRLYNVLMTMPLVKGQSGFHSGDMLNRLTLDVPTIANFALYQLPMFIVMLVELTAAFIFLASMSPYLAIAATAIMPVCVVASKIYFKSHRRLTATIREEESRRQVAMQEGLRHRLLLKSLECVDEMDRRLNGILQTLDSTNRAQAQLSVRSNTLVRLGFILGYLTAFGWSLFSLATGIITFGSMTAFIQLVSRIQNPIANISGYLPAFINTVVAIDRLQEIDTESPAHAAHSITMPHAGVRATDVSFRYTAGGRDVLSRFSYDFCPGSRTLIVGHTGAGKTTLIKLLLGLLKPDTGSITLYSEAQSRPVSEATLSNFVYVPQGNSLLHGTIRENLLLADPNASDDRLAEVLHTAVADFAYELPQGLDTTCDEIGGGLSEGQAQRIAIARALLRPGSIMVLDEFNSALDAATAATLMQRLAARCEGKTLIIIAHHRSAIAPYCDGVLTLSE